MTDLGVQSMQDWGTGFNLQRRLPRQPNLLLLKRLQLSLLRIVSLHAHLQEICMDVLIWWIWHTNLDVALFFGFGRGPCLGSSEYIADACDVTAVHLAPPCGTCSKAGGYAGIPMTNGV